MELTPLDIRRKKGDFARDSAATTFSRSTTFWISLQSGWRRS